MASADNLPLIPSKGRGCGGDVRPVLRTVFRDRSAARLPPLTAATEPRAGTMSHAAHEPRARSSGGGGVGAAAALRRHEAELRTARARRLSRRAPPHAYVLHAIPPYRPPAPLHVYSVRPPRPTPPPPAPDPPLLHRADLMPGIEQNATREEALWVKNIMNRSSGDVSGLEVVGVPAAMSWTVGSLSPRSECRSEQSVSIGEVPDRKTPPPIPPPPRPPPPQYVVCVPQNLHYVNFCVGELYTRTLRLMNVSSADVRLSVRPPVRRELDLQLCGGLGLTAGACLELRVYFRPRDIRELYDEVRVRVSRGRRLRVRIACYMRPPLLEVLVPNLTSSMISCAGVVDGEGGGGATHNDGEVVDLGARLLGETHCARLLLRSAATHACFFIVTDEAWRSLELAEVTAGGAVATGTFAVWPAWWRGGGAVRGAAWCRARVAGLQAVALRLLASTAAARPLTLLADAVYFRPDHIKLQAHEKDYDICSADDPACEYYVHLGTAFPGRALSSTIVLHNSSPVSYNFYWSVRVWGSCSCWAEYRAEWMTAEEGPSWMCPGAEAAHFAETQAWVEGTLESDAEEEGKTEGEVDAAALRVEPAHGVAAPRSSLTLHVAAPDVSAQLGTHRAVLQLMLKDIPRESFSPDCEPTVVSSSIVPVESIPGFEEARREVCEVLVCQLEVWWHVAPLRFLLDPPLVILPHSRRVSEVELMVRATQLFSGGVTQAAWSVSAPTATTTVPPSSPPPLTLGSEQPALVQLRLPLAAGDNSKTRDDVITLSAAGGEWSASSVVQVTAAARAARLQPARAWLGVVPPRAKQAANLTLTNDTYQDIYWWGDVFRWHGENPVAEACVDRPACEVCHERRCSCRLLRPACGALTRGHSATLRYCVNAPDSDGGVATLVRARRTAGDVSRVAGAAPVNARATLLLYRVLTPRLVLRAQPCAGNRAGEPSCGRCALVVSSGAVVRARRALVRGRGACYTLVVRNLTPLPTRVRWQPPLEKEDHLQIAFVPNEFDIGGHEQVEVHVRVHASRVCGRRVWTRAASVRHAPRPLYLLLDFAVDGLEVECWLPTLDASVCVRLSEREQFPWSATLPKTPAQAFAYEDERRRHVREDLCLCKTWMEWVAPPPKPPKLWFETRSVEVVCEPPPMTRVCGCWRCRAPPAPLPRPPALHMYNTPLRTERVLRLRMRSACSLSARWVTAARLGAQPAPRDLVRDPWAARVRACGLGAAVTPARGELRPGEPTTVTVAAYADTWGLYHDQVLLLVEALQPLVLDLWVEAVGSPLQFSLRPPPPPRAAPAASCDQHYSDAPPTLWVSAQDPAHTLHVRNTSRAPLAVHAYVLRDHEYVQDVLPFRVCVRLFDVPPVTCRCSFFFADDSESSISGEQSSGGGGGGGEEMDTGVELYLAADCGVQDGTYFQVWPCEQQVLPGERCSWRVTSRTPAAPPHELPPHTLLLRTLPLQPRGPGWFRPEPPAAAVRLRGARRGDGVLQTSRDTIVVQLCALALPATDVMRVRKRLYVRNVGDGAMSVTARVAPQPEGAHAVWRVLRGGGGGRGACGGGCGEEPRAPRDITAALALPPRSAVEVTVEVAVRAEDMWPPEMIEDSEQSAVSDTPDMPASSGSNVVVPGGGAAGDAGSVSLAGASAAGDQLSYDKTRTYTAELLFHDDYNVLKAVPLLLHLELPVLRVSPDHFDFGYVCDTDSRKTYFTVSHSSRTETVTVWLSLAGCEDFRLWPSRLVVPPGAAQRVYLMYNARWTGAVAEGRVVAAAGGAAGAWCRAVAAVRARASRDFKCHLPPHDHTDEPTLLPPEGAYCALHNASPTTLRHTAHPESINDKTK